MKHTRCCVTLLCEGLVCSDVFGLRASLHIRGGKAMAYNVRVCDVVGIGAKVK